MRERIRRLRKQSITARPRISPERAILITEFYESEIANRVSIPVKRALAFKHVLENKKICINDWELIVGERGSAPKETPTYPEICCHTLEDLKVLDSRKKIPYAVDEKTKKAYKKKIIPFWKDTSIRDVLFSRMSDEWKAAYEAGVFTEFLEQRAPGHTALDDKIYKKGLIDFKKDIVRQIHDLDFLNDPDVYKKKEELEAMEITADAVIHFAK